jgi:hypothetical protein
LKECFFQIGIPPDQRDYFRILWYKDDDIESEIEILRFAVHVWGVSSSPYISTRGIHEVANQNRTHASSLTVNAVKNNTYVDDLLKSVDTIEQMQRLYHESTALFADSGFQLTKWSANSDEILSIIPEEARASASRIILDGGSPLQVHGTMGLQWEPAKDTLTLATKDAASLVHTRRGMLSYLYSFFDPIGFTSPFLLRGKLIFKECNTLNPGLSWDAPLPPNILGKWKYFTGQLEGLRRLTVLRCVGVWE